MSRAADSNSSNGHLVQAVSTLFPFPETLEKFVFNSGAHDARDPKAISTIPTDILDTPNEYIFYMDLPGLSKSDIQVIFYFLSPIYTFVWIVSRNSSGFRGAELEMVCITALNALCFSWYDSGSRHCNRIFEVRMIEMVNYRIVELFTWIWTGI